MVPVVGWVFRQPSFEDAELERRAQVAMAVVRAVTVAVLLVVALSLLDPANRFSNTMLLYGPVLTLLTVGAALLQRGQVTLVGWGVAILVWATISVVLLFFGGLKGHNAMAFVIALTIAGTVVGGRSAIIVGVMSVASASVTFALEITGRLPEPFMPVTPLNSLISVTVSVLLGGSLLALSLTSLQRSLERERAASKERDLAHAAALRAQQLESVGRLAAGVAHDLNNVLAIVQLSADELGLHAKKDPTLVPLAEDLKHATETASLLSRRMVGMSRAEGSPPETLEVGEVVTRFEPLLRKLLPSTHQLTVSLKAKLPVVASRSALEHMLLNLVLNARDAMPQGGAIEVVVTEHEFVVRDTGVGMTSEVRARLFTPFFTTRKNGTGLGLANVAELAAKMKAEVAVDSEVGRGSTFRVQFKH